MADLDRVFVVVGIMVATDPTDTRHALKSIPMWGDQVGAEVLKIR